MIKKYLPLVFLCVSLVSYAQPKLGLKISPSLVSNRVKNSSDDMSVTKDGVAIRPSIGLIADFPLLDNYTFSTGLCYMPKTVRLTADPINGPAYSNQYTTQYLQVPITMKLFTNEIDIDKRVYFQLGVNAELLIYKEHKSDDNPALIRRFNVVDVPLVFGAGVETYLGTNTILMMGLSYNRGLVNIAAAENFGSRGFSVRTDIFGVDLGIKF